MDGGFSSTKSDEPLNTDENNKDAETNCEPDSQLEVPLDAITINVFFDGTGNNMFNTDLRFEDEKLLREGKERKNKALQDGISYNNDYSNVALLYKAAEDTNQNVINIYIEGAGTIKGQQDDNGGLSAGTGPSGAVERVRDAFEQIVFNLQEKKPDQQLIFNVFGFSRGSFYGRYFVMLLKKSPQDRSTDKGPNAFEEAWSKLPVLNKIWVTSNQVEGIPIRTDEYDFKKNGRALLKKEPHEIIINLVGIYDTVVSQGWIHTNDSIPFGMNIGLKQQINKVVHITAQNDYRNHFALVQTNTAQEDIKAQACDITAGKPVGFECSLPGAHADIGGGYIKPYFEKYANDNEQGLYLSVYDDPFEALNIQRDKGEIYWKWYAKRGYFLPSKPDQERYEEIRTKQKNIVALQSTKPGDEDWEQQMHRERLDKAHNEFYKALNKEPAVGSEDNYGIPKKEGVYGELEVVNTWQRYEVRAKRTLWHNSYQFIPLEVMYDLAETQMNAVSFTKKSGLAQLKIYFTEVQADPVLAKFRDYTLKMVRANYKVNPQVMITTQSAGLTEKESQYMYHEYIHASMAAELVHGIKFFSQYTANGGIDNNKTPEYYPWRVLITDNASGIKNEKPDRPLGRKYKDQPYEFDTFF